MQNKDLIHKSGDTFSKNLTFSDTNGAINISADTIKFAIRKEYDEGNNIVESSANINDGPRGFCNILVPAELMTIPHGVYRYDIQWTRGGVVTTIMYGKINIIGNVS